MSLDFDWVVVRIFNLGDRSNRLLSGTDVVARVRGRGTGGQIHIAYFLVHSRANSEYFSLSVLKILAISGTRGSSGLGSQRSEQIESNTFDMVSAGDHCDLSMSRQIEPFEFMFGWYMRVVNATFGGLKG